MQPNVGTVSDIDCCLGAGVVQDEGGAGRPAVVAVQQPDHAREAAHREQQPGLGSLTAHHLHGNRPAVPHPAAGPHLALHCPAPLPAGHH